MERGKPSTSEENNIVYGRNPVIEAVKSGKVLKVIIKFGVKGKEIRELENLLKERRIPFTFKDKHFFKDYPRSQGVIAYVSSVRIRDIREIKAGKSDIYVLVSNIEDPENFGAIIRSSECFGVKGVIFPKRRGVTITPSVIKASAGSIFHIPIYEIGSVLSGIETLKEKGLWIVTLDMKGKQILGKVDVPFPVVLVVGGEGKGAGKKVIEKSDMVLKIPMYGKVNSLNASVSAGIALFELTKIRERYFK